MSDHERTLVTPPDRIAQHLRQDKHGRYVPWFVAWVDGEPDFRIVDQRRTVEAIRFKRCFICGEPMGRWMTFPVGPMCVVNRVTPEPPSHKECVVYSVQVCPFLSRPHARRREGNLPDGSVDPAGHFIRRNPGVTAIYTTRSYNVFRAPRENGAEGILIQMAEPEEVLWYAEARVATREEVEASLESGCPTLRKEAERGGAEDVAAFEQMLERARQWLPEEVR